MTYVPYKLAATSSGRLAAQGDPSLLQTLMRVPGSQMHYSGTPWLSINPSRQAIMCLEAVGTPVETSDQYNELRRELMMPSPAQVARWREVRPDMKREMFDYQEDFCAWAFGLRGAINASEQGTGKTIMAAALIGAWRRARGISRILIIAPKSPLRQWEDELYNSLPGDLCPLFMPLDRGPVPQRAAIFEGMGAHDGFFAPAVNYDALRLIKGQIISWRPNVVVFDESWKIKSPRAAVTKAALEIAEVADIVLCLNGTLFSNDVGDAWSQYAATAGKGMAGKYTHWMRDYADSREIRVGARTITKYTGVSDPVGLMNRLSPVYWRATKATCLDLPEKLPPVRVSLPMSRVATDLYEDILDYGEGCLAPEQVDDVNVAIADMSDEELMAALEVTARYENLELAGALTKILRLQQITSGFLPRLLTYKASWDPANLPLESHLSEYDDAYLFEGPKDAWLRDWLADTMAGDPHVRAIVWCKFNADVSRVATIARSVMGDAAVAQVVGGRHGVKDKALDATKESFNSRDPEGVRLIVAQVKRLAYGHNLQACDWNVIFSHSWSYLERDQLEDRSHRIGRVGPVGYIEVTCTTHGGGNTIDHEILAATEAKEHMAERLARDTTRVMNRLRGGTDGYGTGG